MKLTTAQLTTLFPQSGKNKALTGNIPMKFFQYFEGEITDLMREENLKKYFRGSRVNNHRRNGAVSRSPLNTLRVDATSVKLYKA